MMMIEETSDFISSGQYGKVYGCKVNDNNSYVVKKCEQHKDYHRSVMEPIIAQSMCHPNIVKCHHAHYNAEKDEFVLVQERYESDLKSLGAITPERAIHIVTSVLQGLRAFAERSVIHADLKPENILISGNRVSICDFGISVLRHPVRGIKYVPVEVCTRVYRAPELFTDKNALHPKIDIWSLGCITVEMCIGGKRLLSPKGTARSIADWAKHTGQEFNVELTKKELKSPSYNKDADNISPEWKDIYKIGIWMMTFDPMKRPTARQILESGLLGNVKLVPYTMNYRIPTEPTPEDIQASRRMLVLKLDIETVTGQMDYIFACFREHFPLEESVDYTATVVNSISFVALKKKDLNVKNYMKCRSALDKLSFMIMPPS